MHRAPPPRSVRPHRTVRLRVTGVAATVLAAVLAACSPGSPTTSTTPSPPPTAPAVTATSPAATSGPTTTEPSIPPATTPPVPEPREVPIPTLLRPGTSELRTLYGDLDGDGIEEIVVASRASNPAPGAALAQAYLDVFSWDGQGFGSVLAGTEGAPPGDGAPGTMILAPRAAQVSQQIQFLALVRFRAGGPPDLAAGILNVGAGSGPLDVWVVSMDGDGFHAEFFEETVSGGILTTTGTTLRLDTPDFAPSDPHCCPSRIEHQVIGLDSSSGTIAVLRRTFTSAR